MDKIIPDDGVVVEQIRSHVKHSDIYKQFRAEFQMLLEPKPRAGSPLDKLYLPVSPSHETLSQFIDRTVDTAQFLIGATGIGKSTAVRNTFKMYSPNSMITETNKLIVIFQFNPSNVKDVGRVFAGRIGDACDTIEDKFSIDWEYEDLAGFIRSNKNPLLSSLETVTVKASPCEKVKALEKEKPMAFQLERLKYTLNQSSLSDIIIIVDDIETINSDWEIKEQAILEATKVWECLQNNNDSQYTAKLLIVTRPETYMHFTNTPTILEKGRYDTQWFQAFPFLEPIVLDNSPPLSLIFEKRFEVVSKDLGTEWDDRKTQAIRVVSKICEKLETNLLSIDKKNTNFLFEILNRNFRDTFRAFEEILTNRRWLQKNLQTYGYGAFSLNMSQFDTNEITILRCLAYKHNDFYKESSSVGICNLFPDYSEPNNCLYMCYLIMYVLYNCNMENSSNRHGFYSHHVNIKKLLDSIDEIYPSPHAKKYFNETLKRSFNNQILWISSADLGDKSCVVLSPRGSALWDLLGKSSILLEFYREEAYLDPNHDNMERTCWLNTFNGERFLAVVEYAFKLLNYERDICDFAIANSNVGIMKDLFGSNLISKKIFSGIEKSFQHVFSTQVPDKIKLEFEKYKTEFMELDRKWRQ